MEPGLAVGQLFPQFSKKSRFNKFRSVVSALYDCEASHAYWMTFSLNQKPFHHVFPFLFFRHQFLHQLEIPYERTLDAKNDRCEK